MGISEQLSVINIVVAIIGIVVGCIGGQQLKEANQLKIQFRDLKSKIEKIEVNNSQVVQTINNNGMGYKDTKELAESVDAEKTKNKPDIFVSKEIPQEVPEGSIWIQPMN